MDRFPGSGAWPGTRGAPSLHACRQECPSFPGREAGLYGGEYRRKREARESGVFGCGEVQILAVHRGPYALQVPGRLVVPGCRLGWP